MAKALMVAVPPASLASGEEFGLFGYFNPTTVESRVQYSVTEAATFSMLAANTIAGNSGTATYQFRKNTANGNQTFTITGTGSNQDAVNTDVCAAGDIVDIAYTDTGTNSTNSWMTGLVEFTSGHGCFHGAAGNNGLIFDVASATQYLPFSGGSIADGTATRANVEWKVRGYDTIAAIQSFATANARTNNSVLDYLINNVAGGTGLTYAAAATGLRTLTGIGASLSSGDLICMGVTLLTGVEDLNLSFVGATLKSSAGSQDVWWNSPSGLARAASATEHFFPIGGLCHSITAFTEAQARIVPGFAGTASNLRIYASANTYGANAPVVLYKNGVATAVTFNLTASGGAAWYEDSTNSVSFTATDGLSIGIAGGTSGSVTIHSMGLTLGAAASSSVTYPQLERFGFRGMRGG